MSHTPTPWKSVEEDGYLLLTTEQRLADDKAAIAQVEVHWTEPFDTEQRANAAYILKCVNAHDDLLGVAQALERLWSEDYPEGPDSKRAQYFTDDTLTLWRAVRAILAKVAP